MQDRRNPILRWCLIGLASSIALALSITWLAPTPDTRAVTSAPGALHYFPQTGHSIESPFYEFFEANGGVYVFGYPITEKHQVGDDGQEVQYFQHARMEYAPGTGVRLGDLAGELGYSQPPLALDRIPGDAPDEFFFPVTGHTSSYAFLEFYKRHGRDAILGAPVTEPHSEGGRFVQYFEHMAVEWWPERAPAQRIALIPLGEIYANGHVPAAWLASEPDSARIDSGSDAAEGFAITKLNLLGAVVEPVVRPWGSQSVSVLVTDQTNRPVKSAAVQFVVRSSVSTQRYEGLVTSERGIATVTFKADPDLPGMIVPIDIVVNYGTVTGNTQTSYLVWSGR